MRETQITQQSVTVTNPGRDGGGFYTQLTPTDIESNNKKNAEAEVAYMKKETQTSQRKGEEGGRNISSHVVVCAVMVKQLAFDSCCSGQGANH